MGTINYGTSDYITMGLKPYDGWSMKKDEEYLTEILERFAEAGIEEPTDDDIDSMIGDDIQAYTEDDYTSALRIRDKYSFGYFNVYLVTGYYDGFYLEISQDYMRTYDLGRTTVIDSYKDRIAINKEISEIKKFLLELVDIGLVSVYPGWCTGYADRKQTLKDINKAIKEMREELKSTPTWAVSERNKARLQSS